MHAKGVGPAVTGSILGILAQNHNGLPVYAVVSVVFLALVFGLLSKWGRAPKKERGEIARQSIYNAGALFTVALVIVFVMNLSLAGAAITSLAIGLLGAWVLDALETSFRERWKLILKAIFGKN